MRVGIIGLGYVGLTLGIAAADNGIEVYGIEVNPIVKKCLKENRAHFYEPGLDSVIQRVNNKKFYCVENFPEGKEYDAFVITVGTPLIKGEKTPNFDYIKTALQSIKNVYTGSELVILRSTVSVGTTRNIVLPYLAELKGISIDRVLVAMCPERTVEGKAVEELATLPQIISGNNEKSLEIAQKIFRKMTPYVIPVSSLEEAELVKLYCNTYRDISFAIGNVFSRTAQMFGVNGMDVIRHANQGYSRAGICLPGFVAGPCLEKDAYLLTNNMEESSCKDFILGARRFNESLEDMIVEWTENKASNRNKSIVISGMAFKGIPETSDLRGSSSVYIAQKLYKLGYSLHLHDYVADIAEMEQLNLGEVYGSFADACEGAEIILILNNNRKYGELEYFDMLQNMNILDAWGACSNLKKDTRIRLCNLGTMFLE